MTSSPYRTITTKDPYKICFVCLGNICRSPTAEGVMQHLVNEEGLENYFLIDSAGTSAYHIGEPANQHSQLVANKHGITLRSTARRFEPYDLSYFDLILAMDNENLEDLRLLDEKTEFGKKFKLLRDFDTEPDDGQVPDPYFGGRKGFDNVFEVVRRSCQNLLDELKPYISK